MKTPVNPNMPRNWKREFPDNASMVFENPKKAEKLAKRAENIIIAGRLVHIMARLVNIKIDDTTASADFYPEESEAAGRIAVDLESKEIIQLIKVADFGSWGVSHAKKEELLRMAEAGETDTERLVMWY